MEDEDRQARETRIMDDIDRLMEPLRWSENFEYGIDRIPYLDNEEKNEGLSQLGLLHVESFLSKKLQSYLKRFRCAKTSKICSVCTNEFEYGALMTMLPCDHFFHDGCITK